MTQLAKVEGIGESNCKKLKKANISTTEELLKQGACAKGRREIVKQTNVNSKMLLRWINRIDLYRIKGIGQKYADLLEKAGVDTVLELSKRNPQNFYEKIKEVNFEEEVTQNLPVPKKLENWVKQAKSLPRIITY
jgi:predicted flap endonuclease-1-like 5' DNA nuclease